MDVEMLQGEKVDKSKAIELQLRQRALQSLLFWPRKKNSSSCTSNSFSFIRLTSSHSSFSVH